MQLDEGNYQPPGKLSDLSSHRLNAGGLASTIVETEKDAVRRYAQAIGQKVRSADGGGRTVELIENSYNPHKKR